MVEKRKAPTFDSVIKFERSTAEKHVILLVDTSTSMEDDGKMQAANSAVRATPPSLCDLQAANKGTQILLRVCVFNSDAKWLNKNAIPVNDFQPEDMIAEGDTNTGDAIRLCANYIEQVKSTSSRNAGIVLISDGQPNDPDEYEAALQEALQQAAFEKADRIAIAIGDDADRKSLKKFVSPGFPLYDVKNASQLVEKLKLASVIVAGGNPGGITGGEKKLESIEPNPAISYESIEWS